MQRPGFEFMRQKLIGHAVDSARPAKRPLPDRGEQRRGSDGRPVNSPVVKASARTHLDAVNWRSCGTKLATGASPLGPRIGHLIAGMSQDRGLAGPSWFARCRRTTQIASVAGGFAPLGPRCNGRGASEHGKRRFPARSAESLRTSAGELVDRSMLGRAVDKPRARRTILSGHDGLDLGGSTAAP